MRKIAIVAVMALLTFALSVTAQVVDTTKKQSYKNDIPPAMPPSELGTIWQIFSTGGVAGLCFIFCIYALYEVRSAKKRERELQDKLIASYEQPKELFETIKNMIEENKKENTNIEKLLRVLIRFVKNQRKSTAT